MERNTQREDALQSIGASYEKIKSALNHRGVTVAITDTSIIDVAKKMALAADILERAHYQTEAQGK